MTGSGELTNKTKTDQQENLRVIKRFVAVYSLLAAAFFVAGASGGLRAGQQATPNQQVAPSQQATPNQQTAPSQQATPNQQTTPNQQGAPKQQPTQQATTDQQIPRQPKGLAALQNITRNNPGIKRVRASIETATRDNLSSNTAGLMMGILIGDTSGISPKTKDDFRAAGLSHIVAVSGMNVTILISAATFIFGSALLGLGTPGRTAFLILSAALVVGYTALCGMQASIVRAGIMGLIVILSVAVSRRIKPGTSLSAAAICILAIDPAAMMDAGFQLTFGATAAILIFSKPLAAAISANPKHPGRLAGILSVTIAAQLGVAPTLVMYFGSLSMVTIIANAIIAPLIMPAQIAGTALCLIQPAYPPLARFISQAPEMLTQIIITVAAYFADWPMASIDIGAPPAWLLLPYFALLAALYIYLRNRKNRPSIATMFPARGFARVLAAALIAATFVVAILLTQAWIGRTPGGLRATFIDVGQGDAALIMAEDGASILIDTGPDSAAEDHLRAAGIRRVDLLVVSHAHADHLGGLPGILDGFYIKRMLLPAELSDPGEPSPAKTSFSFNPISEAIQAVAGSNVPKYYAIEGQTYKVGRYLDVKVLSPDSTQSTDSAGESPDANDESTAVLITYKKIRMLFVGDIGAATERDLLTDGQAENIDILKVPHHGSKTASEPAFLKAFDPEYAIISAGAGNPYHHPAPTTLGRLRDIGAAIYRTDRNGSVTLESDGQRITIRPER